MHRLPSRLFLFFSILFMPTSSGGFDSGDTVVRFYTGISMAEGRMGRLPPDLPLNGVSRNAEGDRYTFCAPLQSLLYMAPAWSISKTLSNQGATREKIARLIVSLVILPLTSALALVLLYFFLLEIGTPKPKALTAILIFGTATCFFNYARNGQEEQLIALS